VSPLTSRKALEKEPLPSDYQEFINSFETIVLVVFGTTWLPSEEELLSIAEAIRLTPRIGFIVGVKPQSFPEETMLRFDQANVFHRDWVP